MSDWETVCAFILNSLHAIYIIRPLYSQSDHFLGKETREMCWERYREAFKELAVAHTVRVCLVTDKNWQL